MLKGLSYLSNGVLFISWIIASFFNQGVHLDDDDIQVEDEKEYSYDVNGGRYDKLNETELTEVKTVN